MIPAGEFLGEKYEPGHRREVVGGMNMNHSPVRNGVTNKALQRMTVFSVVTAAVLTSAVFSADVPSGGNDAMTVNHLAGESTYLVVKVDPARMGSGEQATASETSNDANEQTRQHSVALIQRGITWLQAMTKGEPIVVMLNMPRPESLMPTVLFVPTTPEFGVEQVSRGLDLLEAGQIRVHGGWIAATPETGLDIVRMLDDLPSVPRDEVRTAGESVSAYPVQVLLVPPAHVRRTVRELMPQLPAEWGGGSSDVLTEGLVWAALGLDPLTLRGEMIIQSTSAQTAQAFVESLPGLWQGLYRALPRGDHALAPELFAKAISQISVSSQAPGQVRLSLDAMGQTVEVLDYLNTVAQSVSTVWGQQRIKTRLKRILYGMHYYHDQYQAFPPHAEARDTHGRSKLSWRVHLLPFLGQQELYKQFHLNEEWDSPHNRSLLEKMPRIYGQGIFDGDPGRPIPTGYTTIVAPVGNGTVFGGDKVVSFRDMGDGVAQTVVLVEVKPELAVPWTAPQDYAFDPQAPASGMRCWPDGKLVVAFGDSSTYAISSRLKAEQYTGIFTYDGGERISLDEE
jgi:hypothetical protein